MPSLTQNDELVLSAAWRTYSPREYRGRVVLLVASKRSLEYLADSTLGWLTYATGALEIQTLPGDHLSILHPPFVSALAERLASCLGPAELPEAAGEIAS